MYFNCLLIISILNLSFTIGTLKIDDASKSENFTIKCKLNDFNNCGELGHGTFGTVHKIYHSETKKFYIAKFMEKGHFFDGFKRKLDSIKFLENELSVITKLDSPFTVKFHCMTVQDEEIVQIFEYFQGKNLIEFAIEKQKVYTEDQIKGFASELILGLQYLRSKNIAWRDMKLENIIIDDNYHLKLIDFGMSKIFKSGELSSEMSGTPGYVPLLLKNGTSSFSDYKLEFADWFSLGCVLYNLFFRTTPFGDNPTKLFEERKWTLLETEFNASIQCLKKSKCNDEKIKDDAADLILQLLEPNEEKREKNIESITQHSWFKESGKTQDWESIKSEIQKNLVSTVEESKAGKCKLFFPNDPDSDLVDLVKKINSKSLTKN